MSDREQGQGRRHTDRIFSASCHWSLGQSILRLRDLQDRVEQYTAVEKEVQDELNNVSSSKSVENIQNRENPDTFSFPLIFRSSLLTVRR